MAKRKDVPIASAVEAVQRMHEVEEFPVQKRIGAVGILINKIRAMPAGKRLVVFDAEVSKRSTAGNIAQKLRAAGIDAMTRRVGDTVKVYVVTKK